MRILLLTSVMLFLLTAASALYRVSNAGGQDRDDLKTFAADNPRIRYFGRIDFTNPKLPRFWSPGVAIQANFTGSTCRILVNDEVLWGTSHNYIEIIVDGGVPVRIQTTGKSNDIVAAVGLSQGVHTITVCKDTESGIGYLEFAGFRCASLAPLGIEAQRKIEFVGDSITCGTGADQSDRPCGQGQWYDQHNAYLSYGPTTARLLNAEWQLTAVSGIGLVHSCCDMGFTMPQVFDKLNVRPEGSPWDFRRYRPDVVTICLGQNDGEIDPKTFDTAYAAFIAQVRTRYPEAEIICLGSPMADNTLASYQKENLLQVVAGLNAAGDLKVHAFFFSRRFGGGCGGHPDLAGHKEMAAELSAYLRVLMGW